MERYRNDGSWLALLPIVVIASVGHAGFAMAATAIESAAQQEERTVKPMPDDAGNVNRVHGLPIPDGARRNQALGGATTLAPGRNYTVIVYDIDAEFDAVSVFYVRHLAGARRIDEAQQVRFSAKEGEVRLSRVSSGTRISLVIGPR